MKKSLKKMMRLLPVIFQTLVPAMTHQYSSQFIAMTETMTRIRHHITVNLTLAKTPHPWNVITLHTVTGNILMNILTSAMIRHMVSWLTFLFTHPTHCAVSEMSANTFSCS